MLALYAAPEEGQLIGIDIMWEWAEMALTEEIRKKLFLVKDEDDFTAWHALMKCPTRHITQIVGMR
jgi:hypothetical protein